MVSIRFRLIVSSYDMKYKECQNVKNSKDSEKFKEKYIIRCFRTWNKYED